MTKGLDGPPATVVRRQPPPVRQATLVRSDIEHTFDTFVRTIGIWWPTNPASVGGSRTRDVTLEPRLDGRVYETWDDGTTVDWGAVLAWEPPTRLVMSWLLTPEPTEVEFTFTSLARGLTRVAVEHRGWEALTEVQLGEDCAAPGGYTSGAYSSGWALIVSRLAACAMGDPLPDAGWPTAVDANAAGG
jgi:uncharacterized protein YndB with AHSA1/START domain